MSLGLGRTQPRFGLGFLECPPDNSFKEPGSMANEKQDRFSYAGRFSGLSLPLLPENRLLPLFVIYPNITF